MNRAAGILVFLTAVAMAVAAEEPQDRPPAEVETIRLRPGMREVPVTPPVAGERASPTRRPPTWPEGSMVTDEPCLILPPQRSESGWPLAVLLASRWEHVPPHRLLPSELRRVIERTIADNPAAAFRISGETTFYEGDAYLLPRKVLLVQPTVRSAPPGGPVESARPEPPGAARPETSPATRPTAQPPEPDRLIDRLLEDRPGRPVGDGRGEPLTAGTDMPRVVDRIVWVFPEDESASQGEGFEWWVARFESDNTLTDSPMRLLPCRHLRQIQRAVGPEGSHSVRFRVSGEVTRYRGRSYLLLRKVLTVRSLGLF